MAQNRTSGAAVMELVEPGNFGEVVPDQIYRSQFPCPENYSFLKSLGLKTILTLVSTEEHEGYDHWVQEQDINHILLPLPANKEVVCVQAPDMVKALEVVSNKENWPILIHCNKGKHRTGCVVACFRRACGIHIEDALREYRQYAGTKFRTLDEKFISEFDLDLVPKIMASVETSGVDSIFPVWSDADLSPLFPAPDHIPRC
jgi:protein tyrosine/serine phosphatase